MRHASQRDTAAGDNAGNGMEQQALDRQTPDLQAMDGQTPEQQAMDRQTPDQQALDWQSLGSILEALLLVSVEPVPAQDFARLLAEEPARIQVCLEELAREYLEQGRGFQLREIAGGWRLFTNPAHHELVASYIASWDTRRLSDAALETLSVIAYQQPASRETVRAVRGVNSDSAISSLTEKGLVRELPRRDASGRILYGTTAAFLEHFGLRSLRDLPDLAEFAADAETRELIRERLSGLRSQSSFTQLEAELEGDSGYDDYDSFDVDGSKPSGRTDENDPE